MRKLRNDGRKIDVDARLDDLERRLDEEPGLVAAYLFGSYGTPAQTPLSDVDLAFVYRSGAVPDAEGHVDLAARVTEVLREDDVSVVILNRAPVLFQHRVLATGRLLVCHDPRGLADFLATVLERHADYSIDHASFVRDYDRALRERYAP